MGKVCLGALTVMVLLGTASFGADGLSFGLMGGVNRSDFDFNYHETPGLLEPDVRLGLRLGGFVEYPVSGLFALQLGVDWNQRGYEMDVYVGPEYGGTDGTIETFSPYIQYVSVPLMFKWRQELGSIDPFAMAGPRLDFNLGHSDHPDWNLLYDGFKDMQWGMTVGGGMEVAVTPRLSVLFGVLYNFDFENAYEENLLTIERESLDFVTGVRFY